MNLTFWDMISLRHKSETAYVMGDRISVLSQINQTDSQMLASRIVDLEASRSLKDFVAKRPLLEKIPVLPNFWLLLTEIALKAVGAIIVDAYVHSREKKEKARSLGSAMWWDFLMQLTLLANLMIAQPLFFIANVFSHVRTVCDGFLNLLVSPFVEKSWVAAKSAFKAMGRGLLGLVTDGLIAGVAYGLAGICSLIPGAQAAVPFLTGTTTLVQAAIGSIVVSSETAMIAAASTAAVVGVSSVVQQRFRTSCSGIFYQLGMSNIPDDVLYGSPDRPPSSLPRNRSGSPRRMTEGEPEQSSAAGGDVPRPHSP